MYWYHKMCTTQILVTWEDKVPQENDIFSSGAALKNIFKKGGGGGESLYFTRPMQWIYIITTLIWTKAHSSIYHPVSSPLPSITLVKTYTSLLWIRGTSDFFLVFVQIHSRNHGMTILVTVLWNIKKCRTVFYIKIETNDPFHGGVA